MFTGIFQNPDFILILHAFRNNFKGSAILNDPSFKDGNVD